MKINEILEELQKEYNNNQDEIDKLKEKSYLIKCNSLENKVLIACGCAIIPWLILIFSCGKIATLNFLPPKLILTLNILIPASIGVVGQKILFSIRKYKKDLKKYTNTKKEKDLIREETLSNIKINQLKFKNDIIEYIINCLSLNSVFKKYEFQDNVISQIENSKLSKENNELDIAITKSYINKKFTDIRNKPSNIFIYGLMFFVTIFLAYNIPIVNIQQEGIQISTSLLEILTPGVIGFIGGYLYNYKKKKENKDLFNEINNSLGENKLPILEDQKEEKTLDKELSKAVEKAKQVMYNSILENSNITESKENINPTVNSIAHAKQYLDYSKHYSDSLRNQDDKEIELANSLKQDSLEDQLTLLNNLLGMSYSDFKQLDIDTQTRIINEIKQRNENIEENGLKLKKERHN